MSASNPHGHEGRRRERRPGSSYLCDPGRLVGPGGTLANIDVYAYSAGPTLFATTDGFGDYSLDALPSDYTLVFDDPSNTYLHGYYDSGAIGGFALLPGSSTFVTVTSAPVAIPDVTLPTGSYIHGTVTGTGSVALDGIHVEGDASGYTAYATTAVDGTYALLVPDGAFSVHFTDLSGTYLAGYYSSGGIVTDMVDSTTVPVSGGDVTGINVQMVAAPPWSVTLGATATSVAAGTDVTLTATSSENVGPTSYYIVILTNDGTVVHDCGGGLTCDTVVTSPTVGSETYHAVIGDSDGTSPIASSSPLTVTWTPPPGTFHPIAPVRLLDTRHANGLTGKLVAATPRTFLVATRGGIPAGATAITANVTVVNSSAASSVYLGPSAIAHPSTSTVNFNKADIVACGSTIALSAGGDISATYMASSGTTDLVMDVTGFFTADTSGDTYHPLTPARLLDSRSGNGFSGKLKANTPRTFTVKGRGGVPSNAKAVTGNVTATGSNNGWAVYIGPSAIAFPAASTINFLKGQTRANSLTVALSSGGTLSATFMSSAGKTTDLVFDVTGYYTADLTGAKYVPLATPTRLLDTRTNVGLSGKFSASTPRTLPVRSHAGVPTNATGITGIVSVYNQTGPWAVFVGPSAIVKPTTSAINFVKGDNCANGLTVALSAGGNLSATYMGGAGQKTDIVIIVTGYFVP